MEQYQATRLPVMNIATETYLLPEAKVQIETAILKVLSCEAPISSELLTKRVVQSFGIARAGTRIQARTVEVIRGLKIRYTL